MNTTRTIICFLAAALSATGAYAQGGPAYRDMTLSPEERVEDIISRLSLEEKAAQMQHAAPPVEWLGIPGYNWWNECLHGVGRSGDKVTVFPQAIGLAATFDEEGMRKTGEIISTEARAIYNEARRSGKEGVQYKGLTFWTPNINIFRDPRWGRGQETYGEDPYLTGLLGKALVAGLQGGDPFFLKTSACAKHYAVHSGPETSRHSFDVDVSDYDLWDTYLPAFRDLVVDGKVSSVMGAYNRFRGQPCCGSDLLMTDILRQRWGFTGYVTSDCGAIYDFYTGHKTHPDAAAAAADAVRHTVDLECGDAYRFLPEAAGKGLVTEKEIDASLTRLMMIRCRLGMFDKEGSSRYDNIPYTVLECDEHQRHALKMAIESVVLLKNDGILPLEKKIRKIAVLGPNADAPEVQLGNYNGFPSEIITPLEGISRKTGAEIAYIKGTGYTSPHPDKETILKAVEGADIAIYVGGISPRLEGEEGDAGKEAVEGFYGGDRTSIMLPAVQTETMKILKEQGIPLIFSNMSGSAVAFPWEAEHADAILQAWYGGQSAGTAVAEILWGDACPSGRLPVTFYADDSQLPEFTDYSMSGRTYRYFSGTPLYQFGYGLSYTSFRYGRPEVSASHPVSDSLEVSVTVTNTGKVSGDEVLQLYVNHPDAPQPKPARALKGVKRVTLAPGESRTVTFTLSPRDMSLTREDGRSVCRPGKMEIYAGGHQPDGKGKDRRQTATVTLTGKEIILPW